MSLYPCAESCLLLYTSPSLPSWTGINQLPQKVKPTLSKRPSCPKSHLLSLSSLKKCFHLILRPGGDEADRSVCGQERAPVSDPANTGEQCSYLSDFLCPQHSLLDYITKLLEQYTKILIPPKGLIYKAQERGQEP